MFATSGIIKRETIEKCPIIEIPTAELNFLEKSILVTYIYFFGKKKEKSLLALGFGSIYNHNYDPNAFYKINPNEKLIEFIALKDIKKGQEITVNYNQRNNSTTPLWFEV